MRLVETGNEAKGTGNEAKGRLGTRLRGLGTRLVETRNEAKGTGNEASGDWERG